MHCILEKAVATVNTEQHVLIRPILLASERPAGANRGTHCKINDLSRIGVPNGGARDKRIPDADKRSR